MITNKEVFRNVLVIIVLYKMPYYLPEIPLLHYYWSPFFLTIPLWISFLIIYKKLRDKKRITDLIRPDLAELNYTILDERPLTFKERYENFEVNVGVSLNGISLDRIRYKGQIKRHFVVRNEKDHDFELIISIIQTWRNKYKFRIESTSRIRN